ncbi:DUF2290 domain-containing protein [Herbaspirillum sp. RU 5E]|nr:DUF2290 domain-containing protein [Herbaspirillum sp. RU 5E]
MNPRSAVTVLNRFLYEGLASDLFLHVNSHVVRDHGHDLTTLAPSADIGMIATTGLTLTEYVSLLAEERYSAIFNDYSIFSVECTFNGTEITRHRYTYIPCPLSQALMAQRPTYMAIADYIEQVDSEKLRENFLSQGHVRFDFAKDEVDPEIFHPLSHLTLISSDCRIALRAPLSISDFLTFIFDNFHSHHSKDWLEYRPQLTSACEDTIRDEETTRIHMFWMTEH